MKTFAWLKLHIASLTAGACLLSAPAGLADSFTFTANGRSSGIFNEEDNWVDEFNDPGIPGFDDDATIPSGKTCTMEDRDEWVKSITVETGGSGDGVLTICSGRKLTLSEDSTVDGQIVFDSCVPVAQSEACPLGAIHLGQTLTIDGIGVIEGHLNTSDTGCDPGFIRGELTGQANKILTLGTTTAHALTVVGHIEIKVETINYALVGADRSTDVLKLSTHGKTGRTGGVWFCDNGTLYVSIEVKDESSTNTARWEMDEDAASSAVIQINTACDELTGEFEIKNGTLDVNANLCTSGILTLQSVSGSQPKIDVAASTSAKFSQGCP